SRVSKSSPGAASPFGIVHAPSSLWTWKGPPGCASRTSNLFFLRRNINRPALIRLRKDFECAGTSHSTPAKRSVHFARAARASSLPPRRQIARGQRWHRSRTRRLATGSEVALFQQREVASSTRHLSAVVVADRRPGARPRRWRVCVRIPATRTEKLGEMDALRQRRFLVANRRRNARLCLRRRGARA